MNNLSPPKAIKHKDMTIEEKFEELIKGLTRKVDFERWPEEIFFFRDDECLFDYDFNFGYLWCDWEKVWRALACEGRYKYIEIQSFVKKVVEQHFKFQVIAPKTVVGISGRQVEQHFKIKKKQ